jgi:hypothetical protein
MSRVVSLSDKAYLHNRKSRVESEVVVAVPKERELNTNHDMSIPQERQKRRDRREGDRQKRDERDHGKGEKDSQLVA